MKRLALFALAATATAVSAHPLAPALLELRELGDRSIAVAWKTPLAQPEGAPIEPVLPAVCRTIEAPSRADEGDAVVHRWRLDCGRGIDGQTIAVTGLAETGTNAIVRVVRSDGHVLQALLSRSETGFVVSPRHSWRDAARAYLGLGVMHLVTGFDHLLFVLGLVLLVRGTRNLLVTVTSFTAGHSITLSAATLGFVHVPTAPIELGIAASILVLATELGEGGASVLSRRPWVMALGFGFLHGFGFAGALAEAGIPAREIPLALVFFNLGVELGQILVVVAILAAARLPVPAPSRPPLRTATVWTIGSLAAFWCLDRLAAVLN